MPSVNCRSGTRCSTRDMATIMVGAKNSPATNTAAASAGMLLTSTSGTVVAAVAKPPTSNSRGNGVASLSPPNSRPARQEPTA